MVQVARRLAQSFFASMGVQGHNASQPAGGVAPKKKAKKHDPSPFADFKVVML